MVKLFVLALRTSSIGARFLLSFLFIKHISLQFQGEYTLLLTTITVCMLVTGFDFYVYANRYVIKNMDNASFALSNQAVFHLGSYLLLFIIFFLLQGIGITHQYLAVTVLFLIVFEHLGMEFFRTFIALEKVLIANVILFIRTGLWPIALIYQLVYTETNISLQTVINYWVVSGVLSVFIGFVLIFRAIKIVRVSLDIEWIYKGIKIGGLFFIATIAQKVVEFSDRYLIDAFLGSKSLGIYSFYFQLSNVVNVIIFTIFISFMYPRIIYFIDQRDKQNALGVMRKLKQYCVVVIIGYTILLLIILPYLLDFINKPELYNYQIVLYIFLVGNLFLNLSFTSHYALMAIEKDKTLMLIAIVIAVFNVFGNIFAIQNFGIIGAVSIFAFSSITLYIIKKIAEKKYFKNYEW